MNTTTTLRRVGGLTLIATAAALAACAAKPIGDGGANPRTVASVQLSAAAGGVPQPNPQSPVQGSLQFSEVRGITIERFAIHHRVEYAKELLCYSSLTTSQIAYLLGYGSPTYLSSQFKQVTGMTPREFRELEIHRRTALDAL